MNLIPLTRGLQATVDAADYEWLSRFKWYAHWCQYTKSYYARCGVPLGGRRTKQILMHRMILGLTNPKIGVDHINRDGLDNRRANLRPANHSENGGNTKKRSDNRSGFKGVSWHKRAGKWCAQMQKDGKSIYLGLFTSPEAAHEAYRAAAQGLHGEFARFS